MCCAFLLVGVYSISALFPSADPLSIALSMLGLEFAEPKRLTEEVIQEAYDSKTSKEDFCNEKGARLRGMANFLVEYVKTYKGQSGEKQFLEDIENLNKYTDREERLFFTKFVSEYLSERNEDYLLALDYLGLELNTPITNLTEEQIKDTWQKKMENHFLLGHSMNLDQGTFHGARGFLEKYLKVYKEQAKEQAYEEVVKPGPKTLEDFIKKTKDYACL